MTSTKKFLFLVSGLVYVLTSLMISSCDKQDEDGLFGTSPVKKDTTVVVKPDTVIQKDTVKIYEPQFVDIIGGDTILRDGDGNPTTEKWTRVIISLEAIPAEAKVQADQPWSLREESNTKTPSYDWVGGMSEWTYNHGTLSVKDSVYAIYKGRKLPLWKPERLRVNQATVSVTDTDGGRGTETVVNYTLSLEGATLATAPQVLLTDIEEVPVTVVRTEPAFTHVRYITNPVPQGNNVAIVRYDKVTATAYLSDGSTKVVGSTEYPVTTNYSVSYTSNIQVDDVQSFCGRYTLVNGAVSVQGYNFSTTEGSTVYGDAIVADKNYKSQAPNCPLTPIALNINENSLVYEYQGSHDGHNAIIYVTFPFSVTKREVPVTPDFPGRIVWGGATDSYVDGANVATWEGTYMHFVVENNGAYKVYSRKVGADGWTSTDVSAAYVATITNSHAVAYIGNTASGYSLGSCEWADQGNWCKIVYFDANGNVARVISEISKTIGGESSNNCRMPLRGTWANGKITVDGTTYTVTGSK